MERFLVILISAALTAFIISGCSSRAVLKNRTNNSKNAGQSKTTSTSAGVSKDTSKLTDDDLMSIANDKNETAITEDGTDIDKDYNDLDSILNQNDTLSDIPKSVDIK